ncbi:MAG: hypothetical protein H7296_04945 [Bacteroidia bacterium]|nr:hypothetical protein [Bacteroidia bacterium]
MIKKNHIVFKLLSSLLTFIIIRKAYSFLKDGLLSLYLSELYHNFEHGYVILLLTISILVSIFIVLLIFMLNQKLLFFFWKMWAIKKGKQVNDEV